MPIAGHPLHGSGRAALPHPALALGDKTRGALLPDVLARCHPAQQPGAVSGRRDCRASSPWPARFPPSPPPPVRRPCSATSSVLPSCPTSRVVHHRRESLDFPTRPATSAGDHGISRFPHAVLPRMLGVSDRAGFRRTWRWRSVGCGLPPISTASAPRSYSISRLDTWPACSPVNASPAQLPAPTHDSGPLWVATPSTFRTSIYCTAPILPAHGDQEFFF
jgi:hypothetical protein